MLIDGRMPNAVLADVLGRLAIALAAGVDLRRAWQSESLRVPARWRPAMERIAQALAGGASLGDALAAAGAAFPPFVRGMVAVGVETGHEAETLRELADVLRASARSTRALMGSLAGPGFQLATALGVVGLLIFLAGMLRDNAGRPIDLLGLGLAGADGVVRYAALLTGLAVVVALLFKWALADWRRHGLVRRFVNLVPVVGTASCAAEEAAWCRAAAMASAVGLPAGRLVALASAAAPGLAIDPRGLEDRLRAGAGLADALNATARFSQRLVETVDVGEMTGNTAESLARLADELDDEARLGFAAAARGAGFGVWCVVAGLIALVIFRIFSLYVGMIQDAARI